MQEKNSHPPIRLNRYIANAGVCTRREADRLIKEGRISVNGQIITELGAKVMRSDSVLCDGKKIQARRKVYILLNKPKGFITTIKNTDSERHALKLVQMACKERLFPVGQLDKEDTGLLLFTNDGDLTRKLTAPDYNKGQIFQVELDKPLEEEHLESIKKGITVDEEKIEVGNLRSTQKEGKHIVGIELFSHKNRVVKKLFQRFGYKVKKVDRVLYVGLTKKNIKRGHWRPLTDKEIRNLKFF